MMMAYVDCGPKMMDIAKKYWPGPLTVVAPLILGTELPEGVVGADGTIAFRVTDHPLAAALSVGVDGPIVSTSANIASEESPYDIDSVLRMFEQREQQPDIIIDAGSLPHHSPSTIIRLVDGNIEILRQGEVAVDL
jgi:L-threonylcarbamoyladenylate synthase